MSDEVKRFAEISEKNYSEQAIWVLNGFWNDGIGESEAEYVWNCVQKFTELENLSDKKRGADGNELDQFWSAKFLETMNQALTALARKEALKKIDVDSNGCMSCVEYLVWHYKKSVTATVNAPQGVSPALIAAQEMMNKVQKALEKLLKDKAEVAAAVAALKAEEDAYYGKIKELEGVANDPMSPRGVKKSRAAAELAQLKAEDPLPLRRAKITQEAALRKLEKSEKALMRELSEAQAAVQKAAAQGGGAAPGRMWMMERQLFEADSRLPTAKQRWNHSKPFKFSGGGGTFDGGVTPRGAPGLLSPR